MNPIYESNALTVYDYKYDLLKKAPINQIASIVIDKSRFSYQTEKLNFFKRNLPNWWEKMLTEIGDHYSNPIKEENIFFNAILINKSLTPKEIDIPEELKPFTNDYKVNLKNEIIIEDLHYKLDDLIEKQDKIAKRVLELEKKKKAVATKGNKEYKFIDISEGEKKK